MDTPVLPTQPMLRPGVRVVRVGEERLRFGLGPDALVLTEDDALRSLLPALREGQLAVQWELASRRIGNRLQEAGLLIDGAEYWGTAGALSEDDPGTAGLVAAVFARGAGAPARLASRARLAVRLDVPPSWREPLTALIRAAGLGDPESVSGPADVAVLARIGEPDRAVADASARVGEPHLVMAAVEGRIAVGPFVAPGQTACLRCVDAHLAEADPRRPLVVEQYADQDTTRGTPEPVDPSLLAIAWGVAVHDLAAWADGDRPASWSATLTIAAGLALEHHRWRRHPHCGCSWGDLLLAR